jgi:hypothetical protein
LAVHPVNSQQLHVYLYRRYHIILWKFNHFYRGGFLSHVNIEWPIDNT